MTARFFCKAYLSRQAAEVMRPGPLAGRRRFIQLEPISDEFFANLRKTLAFRRFANITVRSKAVPIDEILFVVGAGENHDRYEFGPVVGAHSAEKLQAVH